MGKPGQINECWELQCFTDVQVSKSVKQIPVVATINVKNPIDLSG